MAKLESDSLSLEIAFRGFEYGWVQYEIAFLWEGEGMINDSLLKRWSSYWNSRTNGRFLANDYEADILIRTLEKILETDKAEYWQPMEPDITIAVYPNEFFPFLKSHYKIIYKSDEAKKKSEEYEKLKREKGKLPSDLFTIIVFIDAYNFRNCEAYQSEGISLHLIVERENLESFCNRLKTEYLEFKEKYKVDEYKEDGELVTGNFETLEEQPYGDAN